MSNSSFNPANITSYPVKEDFMVGIPDGNLDAIMNGQGSYERFAHKFEWRRSLETLTGNVIATQAQQMGRELNVFWLGSGYVPPSHEILKHCRYICAVDTQANATAFAQRSVERKPTLLVDAFGADLANHSVQELGTNENPDVVVFCNALQWLEGPKGKANGLNWFSTLTQGVGILTSQWGGPDGYTPIRALTKTKEPADILETLKRMPTLEDQIGLLKYTINALRSTPKPKTLPLKMDTIQTLKLAGLQFTGVETPLFGPDSASLASTIVFTRPEI